MQSPIVFLVAILFAASAQAQSLPPPSATSTQGTDSVKAATEESIAVKPALPAATKKEEAQGPKPGYRLSSFPLPVELQGKVDLAPRPSNEFHAAAHHGGLGLDIAIKDVAKATKVTLYQHNGYRVASSFKPSAAGAWQLRVEYKLPDIGLSMKECQTTLSIEKEVIADARIKSDSISKSFIVMSEEVDLEVETLDLDVWFACEAIGTPALALPDIELRLRVKGPQDTVFRMPSAEEMTDDLTVAAKADGAASPAKKITKSGSKAALPEHLAEGWSVIGVARPTLVNFGPPRETETRIVHKPWANSSLGLDTLQKLSAALPQQHAMAGVLAYGYVRIPAGKPVISLELAAPKSTQESCAAAAWLLPEITPDAAEVMAAIAKTEPLMMITRSMPTSNRLMFIGAQEAAVEITTGLAMTQARALEVEAADYVPAAVWLACRGTYVNPREVSELTLRIRPEGAATPAPFSAAALDVVHLKAGVGEAKR